MQRKLFLFLSTLLLLAFAPALTSAYGYSDYTTEVYTKETYGPNGYSYTTKNTQETPYGKEISYQKVQDYDSTPYSSWKAYKYNSYGNPVHNYFLYGPNQGYSNTQRYLSYNYDDAWRRSVTGTQYHRYYYEPRFNGQYYDHSGRYYCQYNC